MSQQESGRGKHTASTLQGGRRQGALYQRPTAQLWLSSSWGLLPSFGEVLQPGGLVGLILWLG